MGLKCFDEVLERLGVAQQAHTSARAEGKPECVAWSDGICPICVARPCLHRPGLPALAFTRYHDLKLGPRHDTTNEKLEGTPNKPFKHTQHILGCESIINQQVHNSRRNGTLNSRYGDDMGKRISMII